MIFTTTIRIGFAARVRIAHSYARCECYGHSYIASLLLFFSMHIFIFIPLAGSIVFAERASEHTRARQDGLDLCTAAQPLGDAIQHIRTIFTILPRFVLHGCAKRTFCLDAPLHHLRFSSASASTATSAPRAHRSSSCGIISLPVHLALRLAVSFQPRLRVRSLSLSTFTKWNNKHRLCARVRLAVAFFKIAIFVETQTFHLRSF